MTVLNRIKSINYINDVTKILSVSKRMLVKSTRNKNKKQIAISRNTFLVHDIMDEWRSKRTNFIA